MRDDLFPLPGAYSRVGDHLELHATRRADLGASVTLVGFLQDFPAEPRVVALQATIAGTNVKIVRVSQILNGRAEEKGQEWPPVPSTFAVTLQGQMGDEPFGPLESLLHLRPPTEGDPNPICLQLQSRDPNQQGSLCWTSFLDASELKVLFSSISTRPAEQEIVSELLPSVRNLNNPLRPAWLRLLEFPEMPGLDAIPDWVYVEQGVIRLNVSGNRAHGEISAMGQGQSPGRSGRETYEAKIEGSLQATELVNPPPSYVNPYAGEIFFEGVWRFKKLGHVRLRQTGTTVHGTLGDRAEIELNGRAEGNVLSFSWQEQGGGMGAGYLIALPDRYHLTVLLVDMKTGAWRAEVSEGAMGSVPLDRTPESASREDLKDRGYDLVMEGRCREAIELLERARALYRQDRDRADLGEVMRDSSLISEINILIRLSHCYIRLDRFEDLLASLREHVLITRLLASRAYLKEVAGAPGTQENLIGALETYRRQLTSDLDKIQAQEASRSFFEELVDLLLELGQETEALLASEKARARAFADLLAARAPMRRLPEEQVVSAGATLPVTAAILKSAVERSRSTVVEYMVMDQRLIVWVISPQGSIRVETVAVTRKSLEDLVRELLILLGSSHSDARDVGSKQLDGDSRERKNEILRRLHDLLIAPIAEHLPMQPEARITFVPQGLLFLVPFPALLDPQNQPLLTRFTPGIAPAVGVLASLYPPEVSRWRAGEALVVGNPTPPSSLSGLASLEGAEREARAVAHRFGASPLIGPAATEEAVVAAMPEARLIHLACHGLLEHGEEESFPGALVLASGGGDGFLTAQEIAGLPLRADLVVLSACNSGLGRITGDGVVGLSRSFLTAGAKGVVVSLWRVNDDATAFLMTELYNHLEQGGNRAQALRKAMLTARERYSDPEAWAAFMFIGLEPEP